MLYFDLLFRSLILYLYFIITNFGFMIKVNWHYSLDNEVGRYLFTGNAIARGLYGKSFYYVLPYLQKRHFEKIVYFPRVKELVESSFFWKQMSSCVYVTPTFSTNKKLWDMTNRCLADDYQIDNELLKKRQQEWKNIEKELNKLIKTLFPTIKVNEINIYPTTLGSFSSYYPLSNKGLISIYYRVDAPIWSLIEHVITSIVHFAHYQFIHNEVTATGSNDWSLKEQVVDFLMLHTGLSRLCPDYIPTIDVYKSEGIAKLAEESNNYLQELGFSPESILLKKEGKVYSLVRGEFISNLSPHEVAVLGLLIDRRNMVCSYEEIARVMWGENFYDKFSLSHMAKLIHQIRNKLKISGVHKEIIKTKRGEGYFLCD